MLFLLPCRFVRGPTRAAAHQQIMHGLGASSRSVRQPAVESANPSGIQVPPAAECAQIIAVPGIAKISRAGRSKASDFAVSASSSFEKTRANRDPPARAINSRNRAKPQPKEKRGIAVSCRNPLCLAVAPSVHTLDARPRVRCVVLDSRNRTSNPGWIVCDMTSWLTTQRGGGIVF